jgi:glycogen synthase
VDLRRDAESGTGFMMTNISVDALRQLIDHACLWLALDPSRVRRTRERLMGLDWSWRRSAAYHSIYSELMDAVGLGAGLSEGSA